MEARDVVDDEGENGGDGKGIKCGGDNVGDLNVHLAPVTVDESTGNNAGVDTVETDDIIGTEDGVEEETDHTTDSVLSKHIEGVVNSKDVFDCLECE